MQTGLTLSAIDKIGLSPTNFLTLFFLGILALIPTFISKKYEKSEEYKEIATE